MWNVPVFTPRLARKLDLVEYALCAPVFGSLDNVAINTMPIVLDPFRFVLIAVAGWMNQRQLQMIEYQREENRVLREQLGERRLRLTDDQRRRLAVRAKGLGRKLLAEVATIVTPATLLRWHQRLIATNIMRAGSAVRAGLARPPRSKKLSF